MLIGVIPILFFIYLSGQLYDEKKQRVKIISDYIEHIHESGNIASLISELETERKYSYEYALKKDAYGNVVIQRPRTDAIINVLESSKDPSIANFVQYTFLNKLAGIRNSLDTAPHYPADAVMQYYTNAIFRLNTLNTVSSVSNIYLKPISQDLIAQRKLFEMITFLGIIRTNIYNALYTRKNMTETLLTTIGTYEVFKTYEVEFLLKASPSAIKRYSEEKENTELKLTMNYIDNLFKTFTYDSTYDASQWWAISSRGRSVLKNQQLDLWQKSESGMKMIYQEEIKSRNKTLLLLLTAIVLVITFVVFTIRVISQMLRELKVGAEKISIGGTGLWFKNMPNDVMGSLSDSILKIDRNNVALAEAANAIGHGDFDVAVQPRSSEDLLGNSILKMKKDLHMLTMEKDKVQQETLELMNRKDDFLSIASHELKTPVTSLKAYTQLLQMDGSEMDGRREMMLAKMDAQVDKLSSLITNLLDTSKLQNGKLAYNENYFQLNDLLVEIVEETQNITSSHEIIIGTNTPVQVFGDRERIGQVISNFLTNAIKYCPDSSRIMVDLQNTENTVVCSVKDFGIGIRRDQHEKIFERFHRVSGTNLHTYPGLGLGLFIAKEIIERHEGKIWIESEEGKGTTFYFSLPVTEAQSI
ncbi:MAG: HAMP domain-containing histidine kinase [Bacteroidota bacterium]|nr:HAMP domain-containing histidine kinase [Bacteroidota bacterium]